MELMQRQSPSAPTCWFPWAVAGSFRASFPQSRQAQSITSSSPNTCSILLSDRGAQSLPRKRTEALPLQLKGPWAGRLLQALFYSTFQLGVVIGWEWTCHVLCPQARWKSAYQLTVLDMFNHSKALCPRNSGVPIFWGESPELFFSLTEFSENLPLICKGMCVGSPYCKRALRHSSLFFFEVCTSYPAFVLTTCVKREN